MEPVVLLRQFAAECDGDSGRWRIRWQVENRGAEALTIESALVPHGQFKADEQSFSPPLVLPTSGGAEFFSLVRCAEPAGLVTENAFVIFHCQCRGLPWRIFARIRVTVTPSGVPETRVESITTQQVGFSGISN